MIYTWMLLWHAILHNAQVAKINSVVEQGDLLVRQMNADLSAMAR